MKRGFLAAASAGALILGAAPTLAATDEAEGSIGGGAVPGIRHVLLISIDGMHAVDFENCSNGVASINGGTPYCPNLAALAKTGSVYQQASTAKPSDSFPGLTALVTGGTPRSTGAFYDVSYDRSLSPPASTTPYGIPGGVGLCPGTVGTQVGLDEEIDIDYTRLDAGGGINPAYLPRDPKNACAPVYPHTFIRVNTIFNVVKHAGGYTAWSDKHQSYELGNGPSGKGIDDFYAPEINSIPVALPQVTLISCNPLPDQAAATSDNAWTDSFQNIQCYDSLKVQAILNELNGMSHDGTSHTKFPNVLGMNFQAVSVGQKLVEKSTGVTGGYLDAMGTPSDALLAEIQYVDASIGLMVQAIAKAGHQNHTMIVVTAKHGQSPVDPNSVLRIPADNAADFPPSQVLSPTGVGPGMPVVQALEDDVSLLWLAPSSETPSGIATAVAALEANRSSIGLDGGEICAGPVLDLLFNDPSVDPRTPDIIVQPKVGVVYTGGKKKVAEHGGFVHQDTNVMLLVSHPMLAQKVVSEPVTTTQVAPTIVAALGLNPLRLDAVRQEKTKVLPGLPF